MLVGAGHLQRRGDVGHPAVHQGADQLGLGAVVIINCLSGDPGAARHLLHGGAQAAFAQHLDGGVEDGLPLGEINLSGHPGHQ